ncbi:TIGR03016 family PEP-CTERM system-associated outer membrane protein [Geotalea toluenoxydans]|uniref:TIGR03016 family PEP-CTERM system-associated outer membrane protein n=1 Tax=Geotalea toluenoxydans TaxID=421624 RepID=UPI000A815E1C|nr:TIGR03016 family PEP-CTERM system-associated outer membrane protein [Geotalea toluenoxydans]
MKNKGFLYICRFLFFGLSLSVFAEGDALADFEIHPGITVSEEFTDNVYENKNNKKSDYITRAMPGIQLRYEAPIGTVDGEYRYDYRYYLRQSRKDDDTHYANVNAHLALIDQLLFLDAGDNYQRVSLDVSRDVTQESLFVGQTDQNNLTATPYFSFNLSPRTTTRLGYRYTNIWYQRPDEAQIAALRQVDSISRRAHTGFGEVAYEFARNAKVSAGYSFTRTDRSSGSSNKQDSYLGVEKKYGPDDTSVISLKGGWTTIRYRQGRRYNAPFWVAEIKHQMGNVVTTLNTRVFYGEDPLRAVTKETSYSGAIDLLLSKGLVGGMISYSRFVDTELDRLVTQRATAAIRGRYELLNRLAADMTVEGSRYENNSLISINNLSTSNNDTHRLLVATGITYSFGEGMSASALYRYVNYFSGYQGDVNRIALEFRKVF